MYFITIDEKLVHELEHLCMERVGPHTLKLKVVDEGDELGVDLVSTSLKVTADYQFVSELENLGLAYKLN